MPSKALPVMAGLDRKVLNSRRITKQMAPSNPVFSRSFITSFGVASYIRSRTLCATQHPAPFFMPVCQKCCGFLGGLMEMPYICTAKTNSNDKKMKAYLYKEEAQPIDPIDEHKLAIAEEKPEKSDVPKLSLYVVKYKPLWTATLIALIIFVIWALATWLLN